MLLLRSKILIRAKHHIENTADKLKCLLIVLTDTEVSAVQVPFPRQQSLCLQRWLRRKNRPPWRERGGFGHGRTVLRPDPHSKPEEVNKRYISIHIVIVTFFPSTFPLESNTKHPPRTHGRTPVHKKKTSIRIGLLLLKPWPACYSSHVHIKHTNVNVIGLLGGQVLKS